MARVMVVDDDVQVADVVGAILELDGYDPSVFTCPGQAAEALRSGARCDLLVTDVDMPGMDGCELVELLHALAPDTRAMLITGASGGNGVDEFILRWQNVPLLSKPFTPEVLLAHVRTVLAAGPPRRAPDGTRDAEESRTSA